MKPRIKINFADFWPGFDPRANYFLGLLSGRYDLELSDDPDFLIYSIFGRSHRRYDCVRIFYTGENVRPDFRVCDYAFSFDYPVTTRNYRLPLYALYGDPASLVKPDPPPSAPRRERFCCLVVSNGFEEQRRIQFFRKLSRYKPVDSGGKYLNNVGGPVADKRAFLTQYRFTLAFENSSHPGYTTEKLYEAMLMGCLPVYWGNPLVHEDFNTRSFINHHEFGDDEAVIERIIEADNDEALYRRYGDEPYYVNNEVNHFVRRDNILRRFDDIFSRPGDLLSHADRRLTFRAREFCADVWRRVRRGTAPRLLSATQS
jgi:hypothetical protein